jgi:pyruvate dehydrogenase E2 component (dihydrolipoamide acetyltransferase)
VTATPAARAHAAAAGIALSTVAGSGPGGAVRLRDFPPGKPVKATPLARKVAEIPLTGMRRAIADKMLRSHQQMPAVTLVTRADVTELAALRARMNAGGGPKVSYTDFILRAAAAALRAHPLINSVIDGDRILLKKEINIGIAVALEAGLIVPVIRGADELSVSQIAAAAREMAERARAGALTPDECTGGTFTITNLGMYGITEFTPLINIPESAILGVGAIEEALRTGPGGGIESRKVMSLCLTHDHRHIDGAPAAAFLGGIKASLENCYSLIV